MSKKRRGHYCWVCDRIRSNESFSGEGHKKHVCKGCSRLGPDQLKVEQVFRDIDRAFTWDGHLRRHARVQFQSYLRHSDQRIRQYAEQASDFAAMERGEMHEEERLEREERRQTRDRLFIPEPGEEELALFRAEELEQAIAATREGEWASTVDLIADRVRLLPIERQLEVLDFVDFLRLRTSRETNGMADEWDGEAFLEQPEGPEAWPEPD